MHWYVGCDWALSLQQHPVSCFIVIYYCLLSVARAHVAAVGAVGTIFFLF